MLLGEYAREVKVSQRPLELIYVIDNSGSMYGSKIDTVNKAMHELETALAEEAKKNLRAQVNVRIITYGDESAIWHMPNKIDATKFKYKDITYTSGGTPLGKAMDLLTKALDKSKMPTRSLRPIVVLLSDGWPTDDYKDSLDKFVTSPWGSKAVKIAIAIGDGCDKDVLAEFTTDPTHVLEATGAKKLTNFIQWTSTLISHVSKHANDGGNDRNDEMRNSSINLPKTMIFDDEDF